MKLFDWLSQRFSSRPTVPQFVGERNADLDRLMLAVVGVAGWSQAFLEILSSLEVTANTEAEAAELNERNATLIQQSVAGMSNVLREWADWLDDPSRPMPTTITPSEQRSPTN